MTNYLTTKITHPERRRKKKKSNNRPDKSQGQAEKTCIIAD